MGIALWIVTSVAAFLFARMTPWRRRPAWAGELSVSIVAGLLLDGRGERFAEADDERDELDLVHRLEPADGEQTEDNREMLGHGPHSFAASR